VIASPFGIMRITANRGHCEKTFRTFMDIVIQTICAAADTIGSRLVPNR
jgi:hypothetical protein